LLPHLRQKRKSFLTWTPGFHFSRDISNDRRTIAPKAETSDQLLSQQLKAKTQTERLKERQKEE
jgi:hypothetical protein